jgi:hypothetical protein
MLRGLLQAESSDDEAAMAAMQCIRSLNAILYACSTLPQIYPKLEEIATPMLDKLMMEEGIEWYEDTLEMVTCFTYYGPGISPFMWSLLPRYS